MDSEVAIGISLSYAGSVDCRAAAGLAESTGFASAWVSEVTHDPFVACTLAAISTKRLAIGTSVAVALARSPMVVALQAHHLQQLSAGRFTLGLGSQVAAHITRRFAMPWSRPVERMREYVAALRAIWSSWADQSRLDFRGDFYEHTLMPPAFVPIPHGHPSPPILLSGLGPTMTAMAGEEADGFVCHSFTTQRFLRTVTLPILLGASARPGFRLVASPMVATGETEEELASSVRAVRSAIAFYASTPAYRPVLAAHGWEQVADELHRLSREQRWTEMADVVDDSLLHEVAVVAEPDGVIDVVRRRFAGRFTDVSLYSPRPLSPMTLRRIAAPLAVGKS